MEPDRNEPESRTRQRLTRRAFLAGSAALAGGVWAANWLGWLRERSQVCIARAPGYRADLADVIGRGLSALDFGKGAVRDKRILLKPNMVETGPGIHRTTHPAVVRGAAEAFRRLGAREVLVAEGSGHCIDHMRVLEETGMAEALGQDRLHYVDLNNDDVLTVPNRAGFSRLDRLVLPATLREVDLIVSMPKMKTHHWVGVTLSMKNLFGVLPGAFYGWPKNELHLANLHGVVLDVYAAVQPHLAIVDGIVGMEGDGPIMGEPKEAGLLVMGRAFPAVDATCARIMGLRPRAVDYLDAAGEVFTPIGEDRIEQRGEHLADVRTDFALREDLIPAHRGLRATQRS